MALQADVRALRFWRWDSKWMAGRDPPTGARRVRRASMTRIWLILSFPPRVGRRPECRQGGTWSIGCCVVRRGTVGAGRGCSLGVIWGLFGVCWAPRKSKESGARPSRPWPAAESGRMKNRSLTHSFPVPDAVRDVVSSATLTAELSRRSRGSVRQIKLLRPAHQMVRLSNPARLRLCKVCKFCRQRKQLLRCGTAVSRGRS